MPRRTRNAASRPAIARRSRRNWMLIFVVCITIAAIRALSLRSPLDGPFSAAGTRPQPLVIARQGGAGLRPGNTLLAFAHSAALGADLLQLDARLTSDQILVAFADERLDAQTNGQGAVREQPLAVLRTLDAAYRWADEQGERRYRGKGVRIPTVARVLLRFPELRFLISLRSAEPVAAESLCALLAAAKDQERVLVAFDESAPRERFLDLCPTVATTVTASATSWFLVLSRLGLGRWFEVPGTVLLLPPEPRWYEQVTTTLVAAAARTGRAVYLGPVNTAAAIDAMIATGATGILSDFPDRVLSARRRWLDHGSVAESAPD